MSQGWVFIQCLYLWSKESQKLRAFGSLQGHILRTKIKVVYENRSVVWFFFIEPGSFGQLWSLTITLGQIFSSPMLSLSFFLSTTARWGEKQSITRFYGWWTLLTWYIWPGKMHSQQMFRVDNWPSWERKNNLNHKVSPLVSTDPKVRRSKLRGALVRVVPVWNWAFPLEQDSTEHRVS